MQLLVSASAYDRLLRYPSHVISWRRGNFSTFKCSHLYAKLYYTEPLNEVNSRPCIRNVPASNNGRIIGYLDCGLL